MNTMKYKNYIGSAEVDFDDNILHGKLLHIKDLVTYEATSPEALETEFRAAVDDYLADCKDMGVEPDTPFKGQFNVRVSPELHRELSICARAQNVSLNEYVARVLTCHGQVGSDGELKESGNHSVVFVAQAPHITSHRESLMSYQYSGSSGCLYETETKAKPSAGNSKWVTMGKSHV